MCVVLIFGVGMIEDEAQIIGIAISVVVFHGYYYIGYLWRLWLVFDAYSKILLVIFIMDCHFVSNVSID